jgi:hypothetical protein
MCLQAQTMIFSVPWVSSVLCRFWPCYPCSHTNQFRNILKHFSLTHTYIWNRDAKLYIECICINKSGRTHIQTHTRTFISLVLFLCRTLTKTPSNGVEAKLTVKVLEFMTSLWVVLVLGLIADQYWLPWITLKTFWACGGLSGVLVFRVHNLCSWSHSYSEPDDAAVYKSACVI